MEIRKFNADSTNNNDKVYTIHGRMPLRQMVIDSYNKQGYKLYYYSDFKLIEITKATFRNVWKDAWGNIIFFLNDSEYDDAMKSINKSKELYDAHLKSAEIVAELPMSHIYHNILKL